MPAALIATVPRSGARDSLQHSLGLEPSLLAAQHMLRALDSALASQQSAGMEPAYVAQLFDAYASEYDEHVKKLLYSAPRVVRQELGRVYKLLGAGVLAEEGDRGPVEEEQQQQQQQLGSPAGPGPSGRHCSPHTSFMNRSLCILDLGCGTGLAGAWLKDYSACLTGVDISPGMVAQAAKKRLYDHLHTAALGAFLPAVRAPYDLVVAVDVFGYLGELREVLAAVASRCLQPGGLFAFTVETAGAGGDRPSLSARGYGLMPNGRFAHSEQYVDNLVERLRPPVEVLAKKAFSPRMERGQPVRGCLYILRLAHEQ